MRYRLLLLAVVFASVPAVAQPAADAVLDAWADDWLRAWDDADHAVMSERSEATIEGPRRTTRLETEGTLLLAPGERPERRVSRSRINGRDADTARGSEGHRRIRRAFGRPGREVLAPANLPSWLLYAEAIRITRDTHDGTAAWRISLQTERYDDLAVWMTRSETSPRLLGTRAEGGRPRGGTVVREIRYRRSRGLDVPASSRTTFTGTQRRRMREYSVTLTAVGTYTLRDLR